MDVIPRKLIVDSLHTMYIARCNFGAYIQDRLYTNSKPFSYLRRGTRPIFDRCQTRSRAVTPETLCKAIIRHQHV